MSEEFVRSVLKEHAEANVPSTADLWPALREHVRRTEHRGRLSDRARSSIRWMPLLLGSALALLLFALATFSLTSQPAPVSAEEILAKVEQVAKGNSAVGLQNFYGNFISRYRNNPNAVFQEQRQETWFQAPNKYAYKLTYDLESGKQYTMTSGTDGTRTYQYIADNNILQVRDGDSWLQLPDEPSTSTLQLLLFSPTSLADVLERVRLKTPPVNPKSNPLPPYVYDAKLAGEDAVLGRRAYVIELTFVPGASLQSPESQIPEKMRVWVDQEMYAILRFEGWDAQGNVLRSGVYESFQINNSAPNDILSIIAPPDADMVLVDLIPADAAAIEMEWQQALQRVSYQVYAPSTLPNGLTPGRPLYDSKRGVISQMYRGDVTMKVLPSYGYANGAWKVQGQTSEKPVLLPRLIIIQGMPAVIKENGLGISTPVQIGNLVGRSYTIGSDHVLIFDRGGTRIKLYAQASGGESAYTSDELVKIAEVMQPMAKK